MKSRFRKSSGENPRSAMDGVFGAPARRMDEPNQQRLGDGVQPAGPRSPGGRQIGNFNQPEGYRPTDWTARMSGGHTTLGDGQPLKPKTTPAFGATAPKQPEKHRLSWRGIRRWTKRLALGAVIVGVCFGGFVLAKGVMNLHKVFNGTTKSAIGLQPHINAADLKTEGDSRINILLLGIGGAGHEGPDLTDTMLVASIDPVNHTVALVSVPRDLWVSIPHHGSMKINAAYETGKYAYLGTQTASNANTKAGAAGFASSDAIVSQVLGIVVQYNVLLDFQAFQQAVDTVGGVTVNVPTELYDPTMAWENGGNAVLAKPGTQTFDGTHALFYVRSRETTSDFARTQRQRAVIVALTQKVFSLGTLSNPLKITQLIDTFGSNVVTDISLGDMSKLYNILKDANVGAAQSIGLADAPNDYVTTGRIGSQSVVEPRAGLNNYAAIQSYIHSVLPDGYILKEHAGVELLNGTSSAAALTNAAATLKSYGYNVVGTASVPTPRYAHTIVVDLSDDKAPYTRNYLERRFHVSATTNLPSGVTASGADFVVILGQDQS